MAKLGRGLVHIYTGSGKGKTTAALGQALRAVGAGLRVCMIQFIKGSDTSELAAARRLSPELTILQPAIRPSRIMHTGQPDARDWEAATCAWHLAEQAMGDGELDLLILDEINNAVALELVPLDAVLRLLCGRPARLEVVLTGRGAPPELIAAADLVTEMREIKHPFRQGIAARRGIEW